MRISDWSSDVCSSDLPAPLFCALAGHEIISLPASKFLAQQSVEKDSTAQFTTVLVENFQEVGIDVHADEAPAALGKPLLVWPARILLRLCVRTAPRLPAAQTKSGGLLIHSKEIGR